MAQQDIKALLQKISSGNFTPEEERIAKYWLLKLDQQDTTDLTDEELENISQEMWASLEGLQPAPAKTRRLWPRIAAAASILLGLTVGGYFLLKKQSPQQQMAQIHKADLLPGGNLAVLTLSNGQKVTISSQQTGQIAQQSGKNILVQNNGRVTYENTATVEQPTDVYNTLTTPKGNQRPLLLSDGTEVILDAGSSITYPVAFLGKTREVSITGQVFFNVKHKAAQPFLVHVKGQTIEDIGTQFNINAYDDEDAVKTSLVEGSIKVSISNQSKTLIPGQEAILKDEHLTLATVNTEGAIAWTKGYFYFDHADLKTAMRQFSRWYDVSIEYQGILPQNEFTGKIYRNVKASEVFEALQRYHVKFKIEGKKVVVTGN